jgi:Fanconi-associated nuclease 1
MLLAAETSLTIPRTVIQARPTKKVTGYKSVFIGYDDEPCSVEDLCLQYYALDSVEMKDEVTNLVQDGGLWSGSHCEGSFIRMLFGLLMWDVLFDSTVPNVFYNPFQDAPLDLYTDFFYQSRQSKIDSLLEKITQMNTLQVAQFLDQQYKAHMHIQCRGVSWDNWSLLELTKIACGLGGKALSVICAALVKDYRHWSGGLPDLLLWKPRDRATADDPTTYMVKLVEVKGPRDRLSAMQIAWLHLLSTHCAVELCFVVEDAAKAAKLNK